MGQHVAILGLRGSLLSPAVLILPRAVSHRWVLGSLLGRWGPFVLRRPHLHCCPPRPATSWPSHAAQPGGYTCVLTGCPHACAQAPHRAGLCLPGKGLVLLWPRPSLLQGLALPSASPPTPPASLPNRAWQGRVWVPGTQTSSCLALEPPELPQAVPHEVPLWTRGDPSLLHSPCTPGMLRGASGPKGGSIPPSCLETSPAPLWLCTPSLSFPPAQGAGATFAPPPN